MDQSIRSFEQFINENTCLHFHDISARVQSSRWIPRPPQPPSCSIEMTISLFARLFPASLVSKRFAKGLARFWGAALSATICSQAFIMKIDLGFTWSARRKWTYKKVVNEILDKVQWERADRWWSRGTGTIAWQNWVDILHLSEFCMSCNVNGNFMGLNWNEIGVISDCFKCGIV